MKNQCVVLPGAACSVNANGSDASGGAVIANFPRNWKDTVGPRIGFAYWLVDATELFVGANFATSAIPKSTDEPLYFDGNTLGFSLGARREIVSGLYGALSYNYNYTFPINVASGQSQLSHYAAPSNSPSADGSYTQQVYFFNANLAYKF
jgi:long-subunit fatty acid transport protein